MRLLLLIGLVMLGAPVAFAQEAEPKLRVTGHVTKARRCSAGPGATAVILDVSLRVENVGSVPAILLKSAEVHQFRFATNESELSALGWSSISSYASDDGTLPNVGRRPDRRFAVLQSGQATVLRTDLRIQPPDPLEPGAYVLQVSADPWFSPPKQTRDLQARWASIGQLVRAPLLSETFRFTVPEGGPLRDCP